MVEEKAELRKNFMKRKTQLGHNFSYVRGSNEEARGVCNEPKKEKDTRLDQCQEEEADGAGLNGGSTHDLQWLSALRNG